LVNGFFTFDLKDVYINIFNVFIGLLILSVLLNYPLKKKVLNQIDDNIVKDFKKNILLKKKKKLKKKHFNFYSPPPPPEKVE
ncbi:hypothetical protein LGL03_24785, partial [Clostridium tagluense]|nr:hypothetical protein [Clostridium tagluense]